MVRNDSILFLLPITTYFSSPPLTFSLLFIGVSYNRAHNIVHFIFDDGILSMKKMVELGWESKLYFPSPTAYRVDWGEEDLGKEE